MAALRQQHTNRFEDSNPNQAPPVTQFSISAERLHAGSLHWTATPAVASTNAAASKKLLKNLARAAKNQSGAAVPQLQESKRCANKEALLNLQTKTTTTRCSTKQR
ncbi:hypothetical protein Nepgr_026694 [Nepenthes gracilis]|uniref:Uncharacterized protein n=1 Tax=Nepenthes gracilis TaxID=150966 RepID=A0AAD3T904_NEPGR|nr:hypothetical protein Nepgr_026694 [Nepenthes gracilis]